MDDKDFKGIMDGLEEVRRHVSGEPTPGLRVYIPATVDVKAIRKQTGLSQDAFAARFGFSAGAVRDWEQRRKTPEPTARVLLTVIAHEPDAVERALALA